MALADNWRASTGVFISQKDGNDATGTGSKASPYQNIQPAFNNEVRTGYYEKGGFSVGGLNNEVFIKGDGKVVINAAGFVFFNSVADRNPNYEAIELQNATCLHLGGSGRVGKFIDCILKNCVINSATYEQSLALDSDLRFRSASWRVTAINSNIREAVSSVVTRSVFLDCFSTLTATTFIECAFDNFLLNGATLESQTLSGDIDSIGNTYAPNEKFTGSIGGVFFTNCFYSNDLKFNSTIDNDYTLQNNSPLINQLNTIGCYNVATRFDSQSPAFNPLNLGVSYTDAIRNIDGSFTFNDPVGQVVSTNDPAQCLRLPFPTLVRDAVQFFGAFLYNQGDWLDTENYDPGINDEVRLTIRVQIYDENEPNGSNNPNNFSDWLLIEAQMAFEVDGNGLGNGNVDANMQNLAALTFERFRIELTGRTNGI